MKSKIYLLLLLPLISTGVWAQTYLINHGAQVVIDLGTSTVVKGNLINQNSGIIDNNGSIELTGNFTNTATFDQDTGMVLLNGTSSQTISGNNSIFYFLELDNSNGATVNSGSHNIRHTLTLTSGTLTTNNSIVLLSDIDITARIAEIQTGANISGNITMQRYLKSGVTGWHCLGSATSGGTLAQWNDDFTTSGFTGSNYPLFSFNNIYTYNESAIGTNDIGYNGATNITNNIGSGVGFWTYIGPVPLTFDTEGPAHTFTQSLPVTYTSTTGGSTQDGWNLVANPYPSNINWSASSGWTKTNLDNAIYIYDPDNGVYASYIGGVGANGGTQNIASSQSFWVKANAASPALSVTEPVKTDVSTTFFRQKASLANYPLIRMKVSPLGSNLSDETVLSLSGLATANWDYQYDAYKLEDVYSPAPYIATVLQDSIDLSIHALPELLNGSDIPLRVKVKNTGIFELTFLREGNPHIDNCLILEDLTTGSLIDLKTASSYSFVVTDSSISTARFLIHGNPHIDLGKDTSLQKGSPMILNAGSGFASYLWSTGSTQPFITITDTGSYSVEVTSQQGCKAKDEITVFADSSTGIQNTLLGHQLKVYPNPARDYFMIALNSFESQEIKLELITSSGALVMQKNISVNIGQHTEKIPLKELAIGNYLLQIDGKNWREVTQLSIRK